MDEGAFREMLSGVVAPCPFERSILRGCAACTQSEKIQIAERELVKCRNLASHSRCSELYAHLRRSFSFALGILRVDTPLPHAQEMRVQCGGLKGLQHTLNGDTEVDDVDELLGRALRQWGEIEDIPYSDVVHAAATAYKGRHG
jgi:hypothetical protein